MPGILIETDNVRHFTNIIQTLKLDWSDKDLSIKIDGTGFADAQIIQGGSMDLDGYHPDPAIKAAPDNANQNPVKVEEHIVDGKLVGVSITNPGAGWIGKSITPEPPTEYDYTQKREPHKDSPNVATESKFAKVGSQRISISHPVATEDNSATILYGLLHSFVDVASVFPLAKIDESLAKQVCLYLPKIDYSELERKVKSLQECNKTQASTIGHYQREVAELRGRVKAQQNQQTIENLRNEIIRLKGLVVEPLHHNPLIQG